MRIHVLSVPHMGTHWTMHLLESMHLEVSQTHCTTVGYDWLDAGHKVVIPWRDPVLAKISELNRIDRHKGGPRYPQVRAGTINFVRQLASLPNAYLLPVPPTPDDVQHLATWLGVDPPTVDLTPINTSDDVTGLKASHQLGEPVLLDFQHELATASPTACQDPCCHEDGHPMGFYPVNLYGTYYAR